MLEIKAILPKKKAILVVMALKSFLWAVYRCRNEFKSQIYKENHPC